MTSIVLECSKYNDINTGNTVNSNWNNKFSSIILEEGDEVSVKQVFIDTTNGNSSNIVLNEDVVINAYFMYYRENQNTTATTFSTGWYANFDPCIAMSGTDPVEITEGQKTFTIPAGTYSPQGIAEFISTNFSLVDPPDGTPAPLRNISNKFLQGTDGTGTNIRFYPFNLTTGVIDDGNWFYPEQAEWFGASQVALSYNSDQNGIFQFDYLHTPYYNGSGDESVGLYEIDEEHPHSAGEFIGVTRAGGVFIRDLQPRSFWEDILGFDVDSIKTTNTDFTLNFPAGKTFNDLTTNAVFSLDDVLNNAGGDPNKCPDAQFFKKSTATVPIKAPNSYSPLTDSAYFLIECSMNYNMKYQYDTANLANINAIVSRQYNTNNYITGFGECSINYVHHGEPVILSSAKIRILDPVNKQEATSLGEKSSIFLEVFKAPQKMKALK